MSNINSVSIKLQTGVYGQFRNLNNKVWYALGEYVDNAVQSFENNREALKKANNGNYQFEVRITIDKDNDIIRIRDNAAGIDSNNFLRAFEPANIPIDNTGLHEFGMGMKTASIWLSNVWSLKTAAINETEERTVEFDLEKILKAKKEILEVINSKKAVNSHFTEICLKKLSQNAPSNAQIDKIKKHLSSIYRKFIRCGDLRLFINDEILTFEEPEILKAPFYNNTNGKVFEWKKEIEFESGKYKAKGFIAILNTMSTDTLNGLSLFRRGRVIEGSHDEKYRPKAICGQIGSPRYKRIFGELELEGFTVSFNKGSFQEHDDLESLMLLLQIEISANDFDLYTQAEKFIKPKTTEHNVKIANNIVKSLKKATAKSELKDKVQISLKEIENKSSSYSNEFLSKNVEIIDSIEEIITIKDIKYKLELVLINEKGIPDLYSVKIQEDEPFFKKLIYEINLAHPFFTRYEKMRSDEDYQPIISIIRSLVLAEITATSQGTKNAGNVRTNFNKFLRNI
jgi:Histidine kinase-, DNA gyrase B-, and HSP90-like ATPase